MPPNPPSLATRLETFHQGLLERVAPALRQALLQAECSLAAAGTPALRPGAVAPDFALPDQRGLTLQLSDLVARGPVVLMFVRGGWCPFCTLALRAYQGVLPALRVAGAELVALTPQPLPLCADTAARDRIGFALLSDAGNDVADRYGVVAAVPPQLHDFYRSQGHDLPRLNRSGDWRLPLPATFVIGRDGRVKLTHAEPSLRRRLEPLAALAAVRQAAGLELQDARAGSRG